MIIKAFLQSTHALHVVGINPALVAAYQFLRVRTSDMCICIYAALAVRTALSRKREIRVGPKTSLGFRGRRRRLSEAESDVRLFKKKF